MISDLYNKHPGSIIDIIGSGPSAVMYNGSVNPSIAVNGASLLGHKYSYFVCGDHNSYKRDWFSIKCSNIRVIARLVALFDYQLYPESINMKRFAVPAHEQSKVSDIRNPVKPHKVFSYRKYDAVRLSRCNNFLMYGGTISCCALQLAWIMGARKVRIYGCGFTHTNGHYFYNASSIGSIVRSQIETMQSVIDHLRSEIDIEIIGDSKLV